MATQKKRRTLAQEARALRTLRNREKKAKEVYDDLKAQREQDEVALIERMDGEGVESIKSDGTLFSPTETQYGQIQDRTIFVEWAQEYAPELLETKERKGLINEKVRECIDNGEPLPPGMSFYVKQYISQRSAPKLPADWEPPRPMWDEDD